jgi:S-adenosylmethionine-diacylglycerol 3-amino-3-carboxypropyl transferase
MRTSLRLRERVFRAIHSTRLVYVTCWEDPAVDRQALEITPDDEVLTITSGGCNALDLLLTGARAVHAVDINPLQTALLEFRVAAIRTLDDEAVFALFGKGYSARARQMYGDAIRGKLSAPASRFWDRHLDYFDGTGWRHRFLYRGSAGTVHKLLRDYACAVRGLGPVLTALIAAPDVETQRALYRRHRVRERFASPALRLLLSRNTLLALLGIPTSQRHEMEQHPEGVAGYALDVIDRAFTRTHLASNYFWRGVLEGSYSESCCPEYLKPPGLARLRAGLLDRLRFSTASVTEYLSRETGGISKFVLLDHMDWLGHYNPTALGDEWSAIVARARTPARVIFRSAGRQVRYLDAVSVRCRGRAVPLRALLQYDEQRAAALHATDRTCIYGSFYIADLQS